MRRQLTGLGVLIGKALRPVFTSRKIHEEVKVKEVKAPLVNNYLNPLFTNLNVICAMQIMLAIYTCQHLHQRIDEH